ATRPNAKTGAAFIRLSSPIVLTSQAIPIRNTKTIPSQKALKLPATRPERILSDAPPSRHDVTTSRTCVDSVEVKSFTSSGMMAPASVPQVITVESFHQSVPSPRSAMSSPERMYVSATEISDVSQTSDVNGASKFMRVALP